MPLLNLPNPPSGFEFSVNGLGQQTTTLVKSAASILNDSAKKIASSFPKPPADVTTFTPPTDSNGPSLTASMDAIKNGSINKDITASLTKMSDVASSLPSDVASAFASAQAAVAEKMAQAQAQLPKLMAVAQSNMDLTTKMAYANGAPPTEDQLKAASGPLAIFQDGPKMLAEQAASLSKTVAQAGASFGASLPASLNTAAGFAKAGLEKVTSLATSAGASITSFANSVPPTTIPDPLNPGQTIPNPDYATFAANPANASKLSSLSSLTTSMNSAATSLTSAFGAIETKANTAMANGIADLKAFGFAAALAKPAGGIMATVRSATVDTSQVSPAQINKVVAQAAASNPAQPPKSDTAEIKEEKVKEATTTTTSTPKTAIFEKNPSDKISQAFVDAYAISWSKGKEFKNALIASLPARLDAFYPNYNSLKDKAEQIIKDKPDPASRTEEESNIVEKRAKVKALIADWFRYYRNIVKVNDLQNERAKQYQLLEKLFQQDKTYGDCPLSIETAIKTSAVLTDEEEAKYYDTYADLIKAKPELALPSKLA